MGLYYERNLYLWKTDLKKKNHSINFVKVFITLNVYIKTMALEYLNEILKF